MPTIRDEFKEMNHEVLMKEYEKELFNCFGNFMTPSPRLDKMRNEIWRRMRDTKCKREACQTHN